LQQHRFKNDASRITYLQAVDAILGTVVQVLESHAFAGRHDDGDDAGGLSFLVVWFVVEQ